MPVQHLSLPLLLLLVSSLKVLEVFLLSVPDHQRGLDLLPNRLRQVVGVHILRVLCKSADGFDDPRAELRVREGCEV